MSRSPLEVADLIRSTGAAFIERNRQWIRWKHVKVLLAIARCRTAGLGGHVDQCTRCGYRATISYNSCLWLAKILLGFEIKSLWRIFSLNALLSRRPRST
jgi:Transposase zinc-binding domain